MSTPTTLIVLFNLKPGVTAERYEAWAKATDLPIVRDLKAVSSFDVYKAAGTLSGAASPYQYVEIIHLAADLATFRADVANETMRRVAAEFRELADGPTFIVTQAL